MPRCKILQDGNITNRAAFWACAILVLGRQTKEAAVTSFSFHIGLPYFTFILTAAAKLELLYLTLVDGRSVPSGQVVLAQGPPHQSTCW